MRLKAIRFGRIAFCDGHADEQKEYFTCMWKIYDIVMA